MVLQHHAIPTRLIDVCTSGLAALYFATEGPDTRDGRLFVIGQRLNSGSLPTLALGKEEALPWLGAARGASYSAADWTATVLSVDDPALDPRMRAQLGHFLVGVLSAALVGKI